METLGRLAAISDKGNNLCGFLFAFDDPQSPSEKGSALKFFSFRVDPKDSFAKVVSLKRVSFHLEKYKKKTNKKTKNHQSTAATNKAQLFKASLA